MLGVLEIMKKVAHTLTSVILVRDVVAVDGEGVGHREKRIYVQTASSAPATRSSAR